MKLLIGTPRHRPRTDGPEEKPGLQLYVVRGDSVPRDGIADMKSGRQKVRIEPKSAGRQPNLEARKCLVRLDGHK